MTDYAPPESERTRATSLSDEAGGAPVLRQALAALGVEIRTRLAEREVPTLQSTDWTELFERMRRSLQMVGMRERSAKVDDFGMDDAALERARLLLDFLFERWWRVDVFGAAEIDAQRPLLFVANRSGLLPWDGLMIAHAVARQHPGAPRPRFLVADWLVTLPFAQPRLARLGGVRACRENAERLLRTGRSVVAFPEGAKGAAKVFRDRYRVQRFGRGGVVRTAIAARAPLVPVAVVGAEEVHPVLFKVETIARGLGLRFLPVTPTFPALGALGAVPLPSKWSIRFGEPVETRDLPPEAVEDDLLVSRLTEELRQRVQAMLNADLAARPGIWG